MPTKNSKSKKFILKINSIPTKTLDIQLKSNLFKQLEKYQNQQFFHPSVEVDGILSNNVKTNTNDFFYFASFSHTNFIVSLHGERPLIVIDYLASAEKKLIKSTRQYKFCYQGIRNPEGIEWHFFQFVDDLIKQK